MLAWLAIAHATTHTVASSDELAGLLDGSPILSPGDEIVLTADVVLAMPPPVPITVVGQGPTVVTVAAPLPHAFVTAHCNIDRLIEVWGNEYAVLGYGDHLYDELLAFCELTGIKAIPL